MITFHPQLKNFPGGAEAVFTYRNSTSQTNHNNYHNLLRSNDQ